MGIEFSYAAETAFVSPTLLEIGVSIIGNWQRQRQIKRQLTKTKTNTKKSIMAIDKDKGKYKGAFVFRVSNIIVISIFIILTIFF